MVCVLIVVICFIFLNKEKLELDEEFVSKGFGLYCIFLLVCYGIFLLVIFFLGFGVGFIFMFFFWYFEDFGGLLIFFGIVLLIDYILEIVCYFNVGCFIGCVGYI